MNYKPTQLLFIDATVNDIETLLQGALPGIEAHVLSGEQDGVAQITQILQHRPEVNTLHIVSHGSPGCLYLGNSQLSLDTLNIYTSQLQSWSRDGLTLMLYGCNVAAGDAGEEFVNKLHSLTGANIAASESLTGNAALGGNWELEITLGNVTTGKAFTLEAMAAYAGVMSNLNYVLQPANTAFTDISGTGSFIDINNVDDQVFNLPTLPFALNLYNVDYTTGVRVSSNGVIYFSSGTTSFSNTSLPTSNFSAVALMPYWDDLYGISGAGNKIYYQTIGSPGNRKFIVQWNVGHFDYRNNTSIGSISFQAVLYEGTNNIDFVYNDVIFDNSNGINDRGASATIGVQENSSNGNQYSFNSSVLNNGSAIGLTRNYWPTLTGTAATLSNGTKDTAYIITATSLLEGFTDVENDTLSVSGLTVTNGTLTDNGNGTYTFNPAANYNGTVSLNYNVIDGKGGSTAATNSFSLAVNNAPTLQNAIADQIAKQDTAFSFTFDANTFIDVDANDSLSYLATLQDGSNLPNWLKFNAATRTFSGTPTNADVVNLTIEVQAKDNDGVSATDTFALAVEDNNGTPTFKLSKITDNIFKISNSSSKSKLQVTLTGQSSNLVNEIGVFTVDDAQGNINGIAPGAAGYAQAALDRVKVIFSAIAIFPMGLIPTI